MARKYIKTTSLLWKVLWAIKRRHSREPTEDPFSVFNESDKASNLEISNRGKTIKQTDSSQTRNGAGSDVVKTTGNFYFEVKIDNAGANGWTAVGITPPSASRTEDLGQNPDCYGYGKQGSKYFDGGFGGYVYATYATEDIIGVAVDITNNTIEFFKNNVSQGSTAVTLNSPTGYVAAISLNSLDAQVTLRTTKDDFGYTIPPGFKALGG